MCPLAVFLVERWATHVRTQWAIAILLQRNFDTLRAVFLLFFFEKPQTPYFEGPWRDVMGGFGGF